MAPPNQQPITPKKKKNGCRVMRKVPWKAGENRPVWGRLDVKDRGMRKLFWPCEYAGFYSKNPKLHQVYSAADDFVIKVET